MAHCEPLNRRQKQFVMALLTSRTIGEAAEAAGIARRTAHRYLRQAAVKHALGQALDAALGQATQRAVAGMIKALETLEAIHSDLQMPAAPRVSAARAILDAGPRLREALDLAQRVTELEQRVPGGDTE